MTKYKILVLTEDDTWKEGYTIEAVSSQAAIRNALADGSPPADGAYVAIPARSWQPVKVAVETALKFS